MKSSVIEVAMSTKEKANGKTGSRQSANSTKHKSFSKRWKIEIIICFVGLGFRVYSS
jgi:hypothetical protein